MMDLSRRDFMKMVGVSIASLALTNCRPPIVTCYAALPPSPYPTEPVTALDRLRKNWLSFGDLANATIEENEQGITDNTLGQELVASHRLALDELVSSGDLTPSVADLVQEAYEAAVYHVWRSNALMTCYEPRQVDYAPVSANTLVQQAAVLDEISALGTLDPQTVDAARAAIEHDMAFYALSDAEVSGLYDRLVNEWQTLGQTIPDFEALDLEVTPDAEAAAQFIISLLTKQ
jgi:hypothetical protein